MRKTFFTSESVTEGHPDKICDQISDAILDSILAKDPEAHVACETLVTTGLVMVVGEITTECYVEIPDIVRKTLKRIGYDSYDSGLSYENCAVIVSIHPQSPDIKRGVEEAEGHEQGAGDQGLMFGYACKETPELMPLPIMLAHRLTQRLSNLRKEGELLWALPDGKSQVTVEYHDGVPARVSSVVIAIHHRKDADMDKIRQDVINMVIKPVLGNLLDEKTTMHINATGRFELGGPQADSGVTGRKIIVDTYGGYARHGGGAFSGKDPSKVDRSASYMARYIAKNIVASNLAEKCEIQLAYSIGVAEPLSVFVNSFGTGKLDDEKLAEIVRKEFPLKPRQIIDHLDLKRPIYRNSAAYGHFGREDCGFTWEKTDKIQDLVKYLP
ncbi:MAG: methionine adenosyltransferase [Candidatus Marinimicrobia bacterium]|nr:methionine adenosyltransferase [Candidatus Neomarinimicrobiota bacterium]MDD5582863.1 methionine adenosyltransferase [Candidatus Neomarinimicrobiota bacterium]